MKHILKIFFILMSIYSYSQEKRCEDFKVGSFIYSQPEFQRYKVSRTETTQTEVDSVTGIILEASIFWKSECEYELIYTKISDESSAGLIGQKLIVNIIKISVNDIVVNVEGGEIKFELKMTKIESN